MAILMSAAPALSITPIKNGDWVTYHFTADVTASDGSYGRASATIRVVFTVSDDYVTYDISDINVEKYDTNQPGIDPESDIRGFINQFTGYLFDFYVDPANLNQSSFQGDSDYFSYRVEYDKGTGVMKSARIDFKQASGVTGFVELGVVGSSIAGLQGGGLGGLSGFSGTALIITVIVAAAVIAVVAAALMLRKRSRARARGPYGPPALPPPPTP